MVKLNRRVNNLRFQVNGDLIYRPAMIEALRNEGIQEEKIQNVVTTLEPKLISLEEACDKYGVAYGRAYYWYQRGYFTEYPRLRFVGPGGGKIVVDEIEFAYLVQNPPPKGRPKKNGLKP